MHAGMIGPATASLSSGVEERNVFFQVQYFKYPNAVLVSILDNRAGWEEERK